MRKALYILGQLADPDIEWLIDAGRRERVPAGSVLIQQGTEITQFYLVLEGTFAVTSGGQRLAVLGSGELIGEMSFVDSRPPSATVRALEEATVLAIPRSRLAAKLEEDTGFAARFYRALALFLSGRLRQTVRHLGYGPDQAAEEQDAADEVDALVLDRVHLAGTQFDHLLHRLLGR